MHGHAVMGEQVVQERAENAPLWGPSVEDQRSGDVSSLHYLGAASCTGRGRDPGSQASMNEFGGYYGVECGAVVDEQHSYIGIPLVQMG